MARERLHRRLFVSYLLLVAVFTATALWLVPRPGEALPGVLAGAGAASLLAALMAAATARSVGGTLFALTSAAREIAQGRFVRPAPADDPRLGHNDDELDELTIAMGEMSRSLDGSVRALTVEGEKLRTVLDGMSEGVALLAAGRVAFANPAFMRLLDVVAPIEGRTPLEAVRRYDLAEAIAATGKGTAPEARDIVAPSGRVLQLRAAPLAGQATVVVLLDVTEARSLERMRREFVANASHELRTPVAAIQAVAETLVESPSLGKADRARFERILYSHAQRLGRLVKDLLDLSRAEASSRPTVEPVALAEPLAGAISSLRERADEKRLRLAEKVAPGLPPLAADATAVEQVLVNLLENAVKYTPEGGRIEVRAARVAGAESMVRIEVEDSGMGIAAEHLPRIFERFYRVDPARTREQGGTGLGLAIVKHLVQAHGGEVSVSSTPGVGSIFRVTFPTVSTA